MQYFLMILVNTLLWLFGEWASCEVELVDFKKLPVGRDPDVFFCLVNVAIFKLFKSVPDKLIKLSSYYSVPGIGSLFSTIY